MPVRAFKLTAVVAFCLLAVAGCATLPYTDALIARHTEQAARFENARGAVSARKSAAIVAQLKCKSGDIDIPDKQIALEQAIVGSPLILGNKVTLLQDGAVTYPAIFAAIRNARNNINHDNDELNAVVLGHEFAGQMQAMFAKDLVASEAIDPES
jgi:cardiolipin synthase A/B